MGTKSSSPSSSSFISFCMGQMFACMNFTTGFVQQRIILPPDQAAMIFHSSFSAAKIIKCNKYECTHHWQNICISSKSYRNW
jgi:hypothetical protein